MAKAAGPSLFCDRSSIMVTASLIIVVLLLVLMCLVLFMPVVLIIQSVKDIYRMEWGPVSAQIWFNEEHVRFKLRAAWWTREGALRERLPVDGHAVGTGRKPRRSAKTSWQAWRPSPLALFRTFRVRHFRWSYDSGDVLWNAWLYPVFHALHERGRNIAISFTGRNELELEMDNNMYRILKAVLIRPLTTNTRKP